MAPRGSCLHHHLSVWLWITDVSVGWKLLKIPQFWPCETVWDARTLSQHLCAQECGAGPPILAVQDGSSWPFPHNHAENLSLREYVTKCPQATQLSWVLCKWGTVALLFAECHSSSWQWPHCFSDETSSSPHQHLCLLWPRVAHLFLCFSAFLRSFLWC